MERSHVDPVAAAGFSSGVDAYERARPGYPRALVDLLAREAGLGAGALVVDLAAGTGKLTRALVGEGARVVAVEPLAAMAARLRLAVPGAPAVSGLAERLPLRTASVDLLTVAQAFHWFDLDEAFAECARVLRPGGRLALVWNERDESVPWVRRFTDLLDEHGGTRPYVRDRDWAALAVGAGFVDVSSHRFANPWLTDRAGVVQRAASTSYVAALDDERRQVCLDAVEQLVADFDEPVTYPHTTDVTLARRA